MLHVIFTYVIGLICLVNVGKYSSHMELILPFKQRQIIKSNQPKNNMQFPTSLLGHLTYLQEMVLFSRVFWTKN